MNVNCGGGGGGDPAPSYGETSGNDTTNATDTSNTASTNSTTGTSNNNNTDENGNPSNTDTSNYTLDTTLINTDSKGNLFTDPTSVTAGSGADLAALNDALTNALSPSGLTPIMSFQDQNGNTVNINMADPFHNPGLLRFISASGPCHYSLVSVGMGAVSVKAKGPLGASAGILSVYYGVLGLIYGC
jgi:hypothetical protein